MSDLLILTNKGSFLPGDVESVIRWDAPMEVYRNPTLARAMVNLNMIDTQGGGIKRMFQAQMKRFFPMPDYDLSDPSRVVVTIRGSILDEQYTRLLMDRTDLDLWAVILLDKIQKGKGVSPEEQRQLKRLGLIEGRFPNLHISGKVAKITGQEARHIRNRGFDRKYYLDLIIELIREHGPVPREEINRLLLDKLPEVLSPKQKEALVHNLLTSLRKSGRITNQGTKRFPRWVLFENATKL
jgi:ATP-dependent DNA helicase RecG